jgi:hypothetical protein
MGIQRLKTARKDEEAKPKNRKAAALESKIKQKDDVIIIMIFQRVII